MRIKISFILKKILLVFFAFLPTACSFIEYKEKPLNINEVHQKNKQSNFNDSELIVTTLTEMFESKPKLVTNFNMGKVEYGFHP